MPPKFTIICSYSQLIALILHKLVKKKYDLLWITIAEIGTKIFIDKIDF